MASIDHIGYRPNDDIEVNAICENTSFWQLGCIKARLVRSVERRNKRKSIIHSCSIQHLIVHKFLSISIRRFMQPVLRYNETYGKQLF